MSPLPKNEFSQVFVIGEQIKGRFMANHFSNLSIHPQFPYPLPLKRNLAHIFRFEMNQQSRVKLEKKYPGEEEIWRMGTETAMGKKQKLEGDEDMQESEAKPKKSKKRENASEEEKLRIGKEFAVGNKRKLKEEKPMKKKLEAEVKTKNRKERENASEEENWRIGTNIAVGEKRKLKEEDEPLKHEFEVETKRKIRKERTRPKPESKTVAYKKRMFLEEKTRKRPSSPPTKPKTRQWRSRQLTDSAATSNLHPHLPLPPQAQSTISATNKPEHSITLERRQRDKIGLGGFRGRIRKWTTQGRKRYDAAGRTKLGMWGVWRSEGMWEMRKGGERDVSSYLDNLIGSVGDLGVR